MKTSRRDAFKFAGGATLGVLFTPAPWRLLTDTALWSENWPGIPRPKRGEIRAKFTNCSLCPAGCAVRARCVGDQPVSLAGVSGGLCPFGLSAHHLPYHPARLKQGPVDEALAAVRKRGTAGIALLDLNPGRTASWTYRRAMQAVNGTYLAGAPATAIDLQAAKTVLSIGVPLLHAWGTPANVFAARSHFRLIQVEPMESGTAVLADEWMPIPAGTESAFAQGILLALQQGRPTGLAKELLENGPSVVLGDAPAIPEINRLLAAYGTTIVARPEAPVPVAWQKSAAAVTALAAVPDGSIQTLLIDEASATEYIPWNQIERKLVRGNPLVVTFAASRGGYARHATYALPAGVFPEVLDDIPPAADRVQAAFKLSVPLVAPQKGLANLAEFAGTLAELSASNALRERAGEIFKAGQGQVLTIADGKETPLKDLTEDAFWKALNEGAEWKGARSTARPEPPAAIARAAVTETADLPLVAIALPVTPAGSPILTKIYQESNLRLAPNRIALSPADARAAGVRDGGRAILQTRTGKCAVDVTVTAAVPDGSVQLGNSPGIQDVCGHAARAKVVAA